MDATAYADKMPAVLTKDVFRVLDGGNVGGKLDAGAVHDKGHVGSAWLPCKRAGLKIRLAAAG